MKVKWHKIIKVIHRDLGYFFFGMTIIFGISGLALNHRDHWNPNYIIRNEAFSVPFNLLHGNFDRKKAIEIAHKIDEDLTVRSHYFPNDSTVKIFLTEGSILIDLHKKSAILETIKRRTVFYEMNFLHYNKPKYLWTWFSDFFSFSLVIMACTGLFIIKGKNGLMKRGVWFVIIGILIPMAFLFFYL